MIRLALHVAVALFAWAVPVLAQPQPPLPPRRPPDLPRPAETAKPDPRPEPAAPASVPATRPATGAIPAPPAVLACTAGLSAVHGDGVSALDPAKLHSGLDAGCHVEEPVLVRRLTLRLPGTTGSIALDPPATMACDLATALARWAETGLQPLARGHFSQDVARLRVGGGHECRRRNRGTAGPLSEHATGRALDIFGFALADPAAARPSANGGPGPRAGERARETVVSVEKPGGTRELAFLEAVRQSACGAFMTVLGPGSDAAHANHIHLDIQERRSGASRFCQ